METVKIRLRKPTRVFTFLSDGIALRRDDCCIVKSDRGLEWGICVLPPEPCPPDLERRLKMTVVRKATHNDESSFHQIHMDEQKAQAICAKKIKDRKLPMKLVDVEYTFDKHKVVFYFTAADRVDFRELVRDLAQELKTRIELRHIQVRDEAKITGGLGVCGRELCCSTWLGEFKPISMKMAKRQNLSLNPSKISGQCGRLLCCLSYENEMYKERKRLERMSEDELREGGFEVAEERMTDLEDDAAEAEPAVLFGEISGRERLPDRRSGREQPSDEPARRESRPQRDRAPRRTPGEAPAESASRSDGPPKRKRRRRRRSRGSASAGDGNQTPGDGGE